MIINNYNYSNKSYSRLNITYVLIVILCSVLNPFKKLKKKSRKQKFVIYIRKLVKLFKITCLELQINCRMLGVILDQKSHSVKVHQLYCSLPG